jgi:hypothetical protein
MPDMQYSVWNLTGVPDLPREKQVEVLTKLQMRVHELFDALAIAENFLQENLNYHPDMATIYRALGKPTPEHAPQFEVTNGPLNSNNGK